MRLAIRCLTFCAASALAFNAAAASPNPAPAAQKRYSEERAACMSRPPEERKTCLREAGAALQEARRGGLVEAPAADYEKNRLARCTYLRGEDKSLCARRMHGEGTISGSVAGGGIYRELVTRVPAAD